MAVLAVVDEGLCGWLQRLGADGSANEAPVRHPDLVEAMRDLEAAEAPRWVFADGLAEYPSILRSGLRVRRCHDLALTEGLLEGYDGRWGTPRRVAAAYARLHGLPVPRDRPVPLRSTQPTLFDVGLGGGTEGVDPGTVAREVYAEQLRRIGQTERPAAFGLLVAAESASALVAVEMAEFGVPWRADIHDQILVELLGGRALHGARPPRLAALADEIADAFPGIPVNPDSPTSVLAAFSRAGIVLDSTHAWVLRQTGHPAAAALIEYRELSRILTAHGWSWRAEWVDGGRFRPDYIPAGVVSGRWATRGGGALQIPRRLREAVVADPGHVLVMADAGQLEPRVLAAMSGDPAMARAAGSEDMYAALAAEAFGGERTKAKVGLLGAMYGQTGGQAAAPLATLRQCYPRALDMLEQAARTGENGGLVRTHLGRTCPPPSVAAPAGNDADLPPGDVGDSSAEPADGRAGGARARARGRFTRNFIVQGTAAEWAAAVLAALRLRLLDLDPSGGAAQLVFFQHDELVVHASDVLADSVVEAIVAAAQEASDLLFPGTPVRFPLQPVVAERWSKGH
ncbi:MAG: bifunctional 3'-5' exonuclease/DNA polymerase [Actinomycetota bacterium]|nr:bifunctional 3'-5' exonuclease/DNA polymerase [Actinomycetota bacterium]